MHPILLLTLLSTLSLSTSDIYILSEPSKLIETSPISESTTLYFGIPLEGFNNKEESFISFNFEGDISSIQAIILESESSDKIIPLLETITEFTFSTFIQMNSVHRLFPFRVAMDTNSTHYIAFKLSVSPFDNSSPILTAAYARSNVAITVESPIQEKFTLDKGIPQIFTYHFKGKEPKKSLLLQSYKEQMLLFFDDIFDYKLDLTPSEKTNLYGFYKENEIGFSIYKAIFVSQGEEIVFTATPLEAKIEMLIENEKSVKNFNIRIDNAYQPYYFIGHYLNNVDTKVYMYLNELYGNNVRIYYKDNINYENLDHLFPNENDLKIENGIIVSQTQSDMLKVECDSICEIDVHYMTSEVIEKREFQVNEMFLTVVTKNTPLTYKYSGIQNEDLYEFTLLNKKDATITLGDGTNIIHLNETTPSISGSIQTENDPYSFTIETSTDEEVYVKGKILKKEAFTIGSITDGGSYTVTSNNFALEFPLNNTYDSFTIDITDYSKQVQMKYNIYYGEESLISIPMGDVVSGFLKFSLPVVNPYVNSNNDITSNKKYYLVFHFESESEMNIIIVTSVTISPNPVLTSQNDNMIEGASTFRLTNTNGNEEYLILVISKCFTNANTTNIRLMHSDFNLFNLNASSLMNYYTIKNKGYAFDIKISAASNEEFEPIKLYYTFSNEEFNFNNKRTLNYLTESVDYVELSWNSPFLNSEQNVKYNFFVKEDKNETKIDLCSLFADQPIHSFESSQSEIKKKIEFDRKNKTNIIMMYAKPEGNVNPQIIYEPYLAKAKEDNSMNRTHLIIIICVIVILVLLLVLLCYARSLRKGKQNVLDLPESGQLIET